MVCLDSISVFPPDMSDILKITNSLASIIRDTKKLISADDGVVIVTSGIEEAIEKVLPKDREVLASLLDPLLITSRENCSVLPINKQGEKVWDAYLKAGGNFDCAYLTSINEEYGIAPDILSDLLYIRSFNKDTFTIVDLSRSIDGCYFEEIGEYADVVLFDGSYCGCKHAAVVWVKDPGKVQNNLHAGNEQFGLRSGSLCPETCEKLAGGLKRILAYSDHERDRAHFLIKKFDEIVKEKLPYCSTNFYGAPIFQHIYSLNLGGIWSRPIVMAMRAAGFYASDTIDALKNTNLCSPLTSYCFAPEKRYSNIIFKLNYTTSVKDIERVVDFIAQCIDKMSSVIPGDRVDASR